ncbi:MAG TPA: hypothetical protein DCL77_14485, partial [Prolixibacteraceae bacterium]|nr:hypothetical protein [Prolixibacteraceae bacterium]
MENSKKIISSMYQDGLEAYRKKMGKVKSGGLEVTHVWIDEAKGMDTTSVVLSVNQVTGEILPYTSIKAFAEHTEGYSSKKAKNKLYNSISRGKDYEDEQYKVMKRLMIKQPKAEGEIENKGTKEFKDSK